MSPDGAGNVANPQKPRVKSCGRTAAAEQVLVAVKPIIKNAGSSRRPYGRSGRYTVAVKVIDIFGNDTMTLVPVNVG